MDHDQSFLDSLVENPSESLNVELKRWIDPDTTEGMAKIVKGTLALRNRNGGCLVIGFDNKTLLPDQGNEPADVRNAFNLDKIQGMISKYSSELFEIKIGFGIREEQEYPVILVPEGVRTPVAAKKDLPHNSKNLIQEGSVYFRTLGSNGTVSSSLAKAGDWKDIVEICFENREADIGRFLRRHLSSVEGLRLLAEAGGVIPPAVTVCERAKEFIKEGGERFLKLEEEVGQDLSQFLSWEVAMVLSPPLTDRLPDADFLNTVVKASPRYTGWPIWLDPRGIRDDLISARVKQGGWEALLGTGSLGDYMRFEPSGRLYLRRNLQDDFTKTVEPGTSLDPYLVIIRVAEALAVGLHIAKALHLPDDTNLGFAFRWKKLEGRVLRAWANPLVFILNPDPANDDSVETCIELPIDTPISALAPYVDLATKELFVIFGGTRIPMNAIEEWTQRLIERRL